MRVTFRKIRSDKVVDFSKIKERYNKFKVSPSFKLSKPKEHGSDELLGKEDYIEILQLIMDSINKDLKFQKSKNENKKEFPTYFS